MAVVLPVLVVTVAEVVVVVASSAILEKGCGKNTGTWTNSPSLRKTFINSILTLPGSLWYVVSVVLSYYATLRGVCCCTCYCYTITYGR